MTDLAEQPLTSLLAQLTYSPLFIWQVIIALLVLLIFKSEKGCLMFIYKIWAVIYIVIYLIAIYFYLMKH